MTAISEALTRALLDFVWQGLLAAFLLWLALFILRDRSARARYAASCAVLAVMAILPVVTACLVFDPSPSHASRAWAASHTAPAVPASSSASHEVSGVSAGAGWVTQCVLPLWSIGVLLFSLRVVWASRQVVALRRRSRPAEAALLAIVGDLRARMRLARPVRVLVSAAADCPSVVGWIKPVVLLPAATVLGLTPRQLEAVLAHELAHIRRYDYLVNLLQTVVETLLFYHPAVWWASARIRQERELCCDDLAVEFCGDALCYARALTRLERLRLTTPTLALGSTGGSLFDRIQRLAGQTGGQRGPSKLPGILALSLGLVCLAVNMQWARGQQQDAPAAQLAAVENDAADEPGVHVDLGGAGVIHREEVEYPDAAIDKRIQGTVVLEATLDGDAAVSDARVLSGPPELRKASLESVLQWHFTHDAAGSTRQVSIRFELPAERGAGAARALRDAKREQDRVQAMVQKLIAEKMEHARDLEGQPSAYASELEDAAKKLADFSAQVAQNGALASENLAKRYAEQTAALDRQLRAMLDREAGLPADAALAKLYAEQAAEMENRLRVLGDGQLGAAAKVLRDDEAALAASADSLKEAQLSKMEALAKRMADLKAELSAPVFAGRRLKTIDIRGLAGSSRGELLAKLPVHVGDTLSEESKEKVEAAVKQFDEHLSLAMFVTHDGQVEIRIGTGSIDSFEARP